MTLELRAMNAHLAPNYEIPAGATVTVKSGSWAIPLPYSLLMGAAPATSRGLDSALAKYRTILDRLPAQQRKGDPTILLTELSASEGRIAEAETLHR